MSELYLGPPSTKTAGTPCSTMLRPSATRFGVARRPASRTAAGTGAPLIGPELEHRRTEHVPFGCCPVRPARWTFPHWEDNRGALPAARSLVIRLSLNVHALGSQPAP